MKKTVILILAVLIMSLFAVTLVACNGCFHRPVADMMVLPTCTEDGLTVGMHCDKCGKVIVEQTAIPKTGHSETVIGLAKEATCTEDGVSGGKKCLACDVVLEEQEVIPATGHSYGNNGRCEACLHQEFKFSYNAVDNTLTLVGLGFDFDGNLIIPKTFNNIPVTAIGSDAMLRSDAQGITVVVIPDSITSIGKDAFAYCASLTDVYFTGTEAQWAEIAIASGNENLTGATIHFEYVVE